MRRPDRDIHGVGSIGTMVCVGATWLGGNVSPEDGMSIDDLREIADRHSLGGRTRAELTASIRSDPAAHQDVLDFIAEQERLDAVFERDMCYLVIGYGSDIEILGREEAHSRLAKARATAPDVPHMLGDALWDDDKGVWCVGDDTYRCWTANFGADVYRDGPDAPGGGPLPGALRVNS